MHPAGLLGERQRGACKTQIASEGWNGRFGVLFCGVGVGGLPNESAPEG